ncbi:hypothetical protein [Levilactobacillus lindianensis]|uniref:hypothetical protein n=1 Tax=Levilactobacillus lindianensis TaxID=2486018 RepID=UPI000F74794E|nr:hypothetical protein [Levilactobacillus lindianensis]
MKRYSPTAAQRALMEILAEVRDGRETVVVTPTDGHEADSIVLITKQDWDVLQAAKAQDLEAYLGEVKWG